VRHLLAGLGLITYVTACHTPAEIFDDTAVSKGLRREMIVGAGLSHMVFWKEGGKNSTLHVYIGGDGTPGRAGKPAADPTPRNPLMLRLMALDPGPAVYIGRPCYHGLAGSADCTADLWTTARYSERVVSNLVAAVSEIISTRDCDRISIFGYSGGGTLAMLLAERFPETKSVVTIAANLDINAWADHHGYPRLRTSLNPANRPPLAESVLQRHYVGSRDRIVPPAITARGVKGPKAELVKIQGYDHVCCWAEQWPNILEQLSLLN
jgi:pimeloyl-ACP methyl ester carboxylesterase